MLNNGFVKNYSFNKKKFNKNIVKTKKVFKSFKSDLNNFKVPLFKSYEKDYNLDFSPTLIRKFYRFKNIIIIGMGGSILGSKSIYSFLGSKIKKKVFFFDNLDLNLNLQFNKIKNLKNSCFIIISKSGNTLETVTNLGIISSRIISKKNLIVITEIKDSSLANVANKYGAKLIGHKAEISGRYSVFSEVGMLPAALMGLNIKKFRNLKKLISNKKFVSNLIKNVASIYTLYKQGMKNSVILNYSSNLVDLSFWYQQLVGESLGKKGKGINPIISYGPKDHHSVLQLYLDGPKDKFFTILRFLEKKDKYKVPKNIFLDNMKFLNNKSLGFIIKAQSDAIKNVFKKKKIPFREIFFNKNNENELGNIFTFFVLETILLARMLNVNPFNQPAVEQVKVETIKILSK